MPDADLVKTGINGLDAILSDGIPRGNVILLEGAIGTGGALTIRNVASDPGRTGRFPPVLFSHHAGERFRSPGPSQYPPRYGSVR